MIEPTPPRPGEPLRASWARRLVSYVRSLRVSAGPGLVARRTPSGTVVSLAATTRRSSRLAGDAVVGVVRAGATSNASALNDYLLARLYPNWPDMSAYQTARLYAPCVFRRAPLMAGDAVICHPCAVVVTAAGEDS